jgi:NTP pyrophosphatase (non-canonical NTP hydrolase)
MQQFNLRPVYEFLDTSGILENKLSEQEIIEKVRSMAHLVKEELAEVEQADNLNDLASEIIDLFWVVGNLAYVLDKNRGGLLESTEERVAKRNMSKFDTNETDAAISAYLYKIGNHPSKPGVVINAGYRKVDDKFVIFNKDNGKILKSHTFNND